MFDSGKIETFSAIEPKVVLAIVLNLLLCASLGFLIYKIIRRKKK